MSSLIFKAKVSSGTSINDAAKDCIAFCKENDCKLELEFNYANIVIDADCSEWDVVKDYSYSDSSRKSDEQF